MDKIKVGIVNYLNTKPLLYGIERSSLMERIELVQDYPAAIAQMLVDGAIDVGLVPVAIIPRLPQATIITDYCIGCNGPVASVCIFSQVPLPDVEEVLLDYQSRTSAALARILLRDYWKLSPRLTDTSNEFAERIKDNTAGLLIGDRALAQRKSSAYIYDLGDAWKQLTGLPFVFAAWIANKPLPPEFVEQFNAANADGVRQVDRVISELNNGIFDLEKYYSNHINYLLDQHKKQGLNLFLSLLPSNTEKIFD